MTAALGTSEVELFTGSATGFTRKLSVAADAAADIDELSSGLTKLIPRKGVSELFGAFHATVLDKSVARIGDYIDILRLSCGC